MKDVLIVGQGVAGSCLAWELMRRGKRVTVVDDGHRQSSSIISAGIMNPVTGKRFIVQPGYDEAFHAAEKFYQIIERESGIAFFQTWPVYKIFQSKDERELWRKQSQRTENQKYFGEERPSGRFPGLIHDPWGSGDIDHAAVCRSDLFLSALRGIFEREKILEHRRFLYDDMTFVDGTIRYGQDSYRAVIFCEGHRARTNPFFSWLPFNNAKGEILRIRMEASRFPDAVFNGGKWILPLENNEWLAGATYRWNEEDAADGEEILQALKGFISKDFRVLSLTSGIRPVMKDIHPVLGPHPERKNILIFNGFGSKGFLLAPLLSSMLVDQIEGVKPVPDAYSIRRFAASRPTTWETAQDSTRVSAEGI